MNFSNFIWVFLNEVIKAGDNTPTKLSVLMYCYFQMMYNFGSLFKKKAIQSTDRVKPLPEYNVLKTLLTSSAFESSRYKILCNFLYVGHTSFLTAIYKTAPLSKRDYGIEPCLIKPELEAMLAKWSVEHYTGKAVELSRAGISTANTTGLPADFKGSSDDSKYWIQLIVPTGVTTAPNNLPLIDPANPLSFRIQNFLGKEYYLNSGFAVSPTKNIINLSDKISKTWDTGLKEQMDKILEIYKALDDEKKMTAELFAGSSKGILPPPGFFICVAIQLSQKYKQNIQNDLAMYFSLACGIFDASVSAWYYKSTYTQARPISLIRNNYTNNVITTWTPLNPGKLNGNIPGNQWLPYQELTFVTPPFPDVASGHTAFSRVAGKILDWWFNKPVLYDGFSRVSVPNLSLVCPSLSILQKEVCIGEYIFEKGSSNIEPNITPQKRTILRYKTVEDLYKAAGISRVYGGIHSLQTNEVTADLADWVFQQTYNKLINDFKFESPYYKETDCIREASLKF